LLLAAAVSAQTASAPTAAQKLDIRVIGEPELRQGSDGKILTTVRFEFVDKNGRKAASLPDEEITIYEDGHKVYAFRPQTLRVEPLVAMLAMDTSESMVGTRRSPSNKFQEAKRAASTFFTKLDSSAPCGLVLFNHAPYFVEPPDRERERLRQFVEGAKASGGTAYLDAANVAVQRLAASEFEGQRIAVVMTDGRDNNSKRDLNTVIANANQNQVRIYTVGLGQPGHNEIVRTVLVLDRSESMRGQKFAAMQKAAASFVQLMPSKSAETTLLPFDDVVSVAGPFTNNQHKLIEEISALRPKGRTALYAAMEQGLKTLLASRDSRPAHLKLVVLTDGHDTSSVNTTPEDVIRLANRHEIKVFTLGLGQGREINEEVLRRIADKTGGEYYPVRNPDQLIDLFERLSISLHDDGIDVASLTTLAEKTGGRYYQVSQADQLAATFERVATSLETSYTVTFEARRKRLDGTKSKITIRFGKHAEGGTEYSTPGLIVPLAREWLFVSLAVLLGMMLVVPPVLRRLSPREDTGR
jgi:VWFA-related protein